MGVRAAAADPAPLPPQAASLGLGDEWDAVKTAYAAANRALGDIVKVAGEGGRVFGGFKKTPKKPNP